MGRRHPEPGCPACHHAPCGPPRGLEPKCPGCGAAFRSPIVAAALSVTLPGAGHFYLRRHALAGVEFGVGLLLFTLALLGLGRLFVRVLDDRAVPLDLLRACLPWGIVLASYSLLDGAFTWLVSRRRIVLATAAKGPS